MIDDGRITTQTSKRFVDCQRPTVWSTHAASRAATTVHSLNKVLRAARLFLPCLTSSSADFVPLVTS